MNRKRVNILGHFKPLRRKARFKVCRSGRGSAKSTAIGQTLLLMARKMRIRIACLRQFQNAIDESVYALLVELIHEWGIEDEWTITRTTITHVETGSHFFFRGLDRNLRTVIKGLQSVDIVFVEEAENISLEAWRLLIPTVRKPGSEIWVAYNPNLPTDATDILFCGDAPPDDMILIENNYLDNPFCSDDFIADAEHMRIHFPDEYAHYYLGAYAPDLEGTLIPLKHVQEACDREEQPIDLDLPVIAGLDVARGQRDTNAVVVRQGDEILYWKEWHAADMVDITSDFAEVCIKYGATHAVLDATNLGGGGAADIWKRFGRVGNIKIVEFMGGHKPGSSKYKNARAEVWDRMYQHLRAGLNLRKCPWALKELPTVRKRHDLKDKLILESKDDMSKRGIASPNLGDALSMTYSSRIHTGSTEKKADLESLYDG